LYFYCQIEIKMIQYILAAGFGALLASRNNKKMGRGGKAQGYDDRLDESLSMHDGAEKTKKQSKKDRRDESAGMEKSMGRRKYASVGTMDRGSKYEILPRPPKDYIAYVIDMDGNASLKYSKTFQGANRMMQNMLKKNQDVSTHGISKYDPFYGTHIFYGHGEAISFEPLKGFAKGGKTQGYDDRGDEELGMTDGKESRFQQSKKDRRDEMKGENRSAGNKTYGSFARGGLIQVKSGNKGKWETIYQEPKNTKSEKRANMFFDEEKARGKSVFLLVDNEVWEEHIAKGDEEEYAKGGEVGVGVGDSIIIRQEIYGHTHGGAMHLLKIGQKGNIDSIDEEREIVGIQLENFEKVYVHIDDLDPYYIEVISTYAKGGKMQGYNARGDEELGMTDGKESRFKQSKKDRRDEMKGENRAAGNKTYGSFEKGGDTNWVQEVVDSPDFRKGAFTKKAKKRGLTPEEFMRKVLKNPSEYNERTRRQAQFMKNIGD
jgi:hypothetical protein